VGLLRAELLTRGPAVCGSVNQSGKNPRSARVATCTRQVVPAYSRRIRRALACPIVAEGTIGLTLKRADWLDEPKAQHLLRNAGVQVKKSDFWKNLNSFEHESRLTVKFVDN
jgi:hypothetical protein